MDGFDEFSEHRERPLPGQRLGAWVRENGLVIFYAVLLMTVIFARGLWAPGEPDFAQSVRGMREDGSWLLPYLKDNHYSENSIFFYWLLKLCTVGADALTGGAGFTHGVAAWALRIPSVLGSIAFLFAFRKWASRFLQRDVAELATMILCAAPLWFWQSQYIQVDLLFATMLGWSWLCWLAGYLLLRGQTEGMENEHRRWFRISFLWLGLAVIALGLLALFLSALLLIAFLIWQRDLKALKGTWLLEGAGIVTLLALPWFLLTGYFTHATHAWDPFQPWDKYAEYWLGGFFPWVLLLPALAFFLRGSGAHRAPVVRFMMLGCLLPALLLGWSRSNQGTFLLLTYPFLSLLLAGMLQPIAVEGVGPARIRRIGGLLAVGLWLPALALLVLGFTPLGGASLHAQITPILGPLRLSAVVLMLGATSVTTRCLLGEGRYLVRETTATLCALYLIGGTWGFHRLDPEKKFRHGFDVLLGVAPGEGEILLEKKKTSFTKDLP